MARKFKLVPDPTFKKAVDIPIPGGRPQPVEFVFKHRNKEAMAEWFEAIGKHKSDAAMVLDIASGWDLEEPFDEQHIEQLCVEYAGAGAAIVQTYIAEMTGGQVRLGNSAP